MVPGEVSATAVLAEENILIITASRLFFILIMFNNDIDKTKDINSSGAVAVSKYECITGCAGLKLITVLYGIILISWDKTGYGNPVQKI